MNNTMWYVQTKFQKILDETSFAGRKRQIVMTILEIYSSFTWYTLNHDQSYHSNTVTSCRFLYIPFSDKLDVCLKNGSRILFGRENVNNAKQFVQVVGNFSYWHCVKKAVSWNIQDSDFPWYLSCTGLVRDVSGYFKYTRISNTVYSILWSVREYQIPYT